MDLSLCTLRCSFAPFVFVDVAYPRSSSLQQDCSVARVKIREACWPMAKLALHGRLFCAFHKQLKKLMSYGVRLGC